MSIEGRAATLADLESLVALGRAFHGESTYRAGPFEPERVRSAFQNAIAHAPHRCVLVATDGETRAGMLAGHLDRRLWCAEAIAFDTVFYVDPRHRNGVAARRLIDAFRAWARSKGARELCLAVTSGIRSDRTDVFLRRLGFEVAGRVYTQRLG